MSNTSLKGITRIDRDDPPKRRKHGFQVYVGWRGRELREFVSDEDHYEPMVAAVELRASMEKRLGKSRTEEIVRSSGVIQTAQGETRQWKR